MLYGLQTIPRDYAIIMTFLQTGIRLSELANLRIEDVDFDNKAHRPEGKGEEDRQIPLVDEESQSASQLPPLPGENQLLVHHEYSLAKTAPH